MCGDFCKMRPKFDDTLLARVEHVPVPAEAAVFWDQRLPHGNARFQFKNTRGWSYMVVGSPPCQ